MCGGGIRGAKRCDGRGRQGQDGGALWAGGVRSGKQLRGGEGEVSAPGRPSPPPPRRHRGQPRGRRGGDRAERGAGKQGERAGGRRRQEKGKGSGGWGRRGVMLPFRPLSCTPLSPFLPSRQTCFEGLPRAPPPPRRVPSPAKAPFNSAFFIEKGSAPPLQRLIPRFPLPWLRRFPSPGLGIK